MSAESTGPEISSKSDDTFRPVGGIVRAWL